MPNLVLTQASGSFSVLRPIVYPNFKAYAKRVGADFESIEDCRRPDCPLLEKLRIGEYLGAYDRVLFLDGDLLVRPDCPNLFGLVPPGHYAAYDEGAACRVTFEIEARIDAVNGIARFFGLPAPQWPPKFSYLNSGVILVDRCHKPIFGQPCPEPVPNPTGHNVCAEQNYLNYMVMRHKAKVWHLPVCFNQMPWNNTTDHLDCSYIVHFAGMGTAESRVKPMAEAIRHWRGDLGL